MKTVQFEYGQGYMEADLPDGADVFIPGETIPDPPYLDDVETATRNSILNPIGMPPISKLVGAGSKVTISFPDRVKGGFQENSHRKTAIPILIEECLKAGVNKEDILLICSNGLHRKNTEEEIRSILGDQVYHQFTASHQIINHDSEDWENLVDLGCDEMGNPVIMNRQVFESDLPILIGHVLGNPYGGYSGGYKMASTGITHWKSIASHHIPGIMHQPDFIKVSHHSGMRTRFDSIGMWMEKKMGRNFFMCDAVLDSRQRQIAIFSGYGKEMQPKSFEVANKRTREKYDIMIFGCVVVCASICNGYFHDEEFPSYRELYELFQKDYHNILPDVEKYGEYFSNKQEYVDKYRYNFGYHPYHAFSMVSCGHIIEMETAAAYIVGAYEPGYARAMGMKTRATFAEALKDAQRYTGPDPRILALPRTFRTAGVHLMMENEPLPGI